MGEWLAEPRLDSNASDPRKRTTSKPEQVHRLKNGDCQVDGYPDPTDGAPVPGWRLLDFLPR
jgi:hypothetical protein